MSCRSDNLAGQFFRLLSPATASKRLALFGIMSQIHFQIMSDLHLETPKARPSYEDFNIEPQCPYLALLGDIGNVSDSRLFDFLNCQLQKFQIVFYILGNHEPYGSTFAKAVARVRAFEMTAEQQRRSPYNSSRGQFVYLNRERFDISDRLTVLGCTLFSKVSLEQYNSATHFVSDFSEIDDWTVDSHNRAHEMDLQWLDSEVTSLAQVEPNRSIVIFTHHSPTILEAANNPDHARDDLQVQSAFVTDLSTRFCWTSLQVKLWAFGHTHFNCDFSDPQTGKRIVTNQKGYRKSESLTFSHTKVIDVPNCLDTKSGLLRLEQGKEKNSGHRKHCVTF